MTFRLFPRGRVAKTRAVNARRLDAGEPFPRLAWRTVDEGSLVVPDAFAGRWAVILFYRGHW